MGKPIKLNRLLSLDAPSRVDDGAGGFTETWEEQGLLWAECTARSGREVLDAGVSLSRTPYRIIVRSAPYGAPSRPAPEQRFRDGQRIYHIQSVAELGGDGRYLVCLAEEEIAV